MNFCSACGQPVIFKIPEGDNRPRYVCDHCQTIHYQNPRAITLTLPIAPDGRILLCKRNIEPQKNYWTLPGGFMENDESTLQGALRETWEEARVKADTGELFAVISVPKWHQVHLFYRIQMPDFSFAATEESSEVKLFNETEIPWSSLAFKTVECALKHYLELPKAGFSVLNTSLSG
ncbi:NUDIX hydrolase [Reinekea thalattae]|uniref:NUDIX hydrolase n=1 Tax=Reinekea thalattae TaxID=2593301 RepID=A0A5C8Z6S1_9GAMM|nr:NUDIX hydrolase [Reinekea thalattae]TXR53327.1 NUDIX hydrolase [Reinekea thalattae]